MEELKITEDHARQVVFVETPKRKERVVIFVPMTGRAEWRVSYESGKRIPEISGAFLSRKEALRAVTSWLDKTKITKDAKHDLLFGEDQKKQIRKKKSATRAKTDNS